MLRFVEMAERVQQAVQPTERDDASLDVRRLPHRIDGAKASGAADKRALAFEINNILVAMRAPGHEEAEARVVLNALDGHHLDGMVDKDGRACRKEAVETLLECGFPHALEVSHEDLTFARAWVPPRDSLETPWAEQLARTRRNGAAVVLGGEVLFVVMLAIMGAQNGMVIALAAVAGLAASVAAILFANSEPKLEGQSKWGTALVLSAIVQLLTAFSIGPAALVGGVGIIFGLVIAFAGQAQPLEDPPTGTGSVD
jgi:hypothetical protein